jgi:membrane dipeptidase
MARTGADRLTRRRLLQGAAGTAALGIGLPMLNFASFRLFADSPAAYSARAVGLIERSLVIDMLAVLKIDFTPAAYASPLTEKQVAEFRTCGITGFHNAIGTGGPQAVEETLEFLAAWQGFCGRNADLFSVVDTAADLDRAKAEKKCAVIMGVQNSEHFRGPEDVRKFHQLGQRCSQLTYNSQNFLGTGGTDRVDGGVSDFGASIIDAMNSVGMLVDASHCGDRTTLDAIELSRHPIAITHSNCRALNNHPRLKTDEAIVKLAAKGGVMGITGVRNFVRDREPTTIEHIVDHIDHVVKLAGIEHVGIGSDSDLNGYDDMPADQRKELMASYKSSYAFRDKLDTDGFDHPKKVFDLTEALIRRGYGDSNIEAVLGGNFRRLLGTVWVPEPAKSEKGDGP